MAMHTWFECKIRYEKLMENGMNKKVTEPYLVDALSFTEAEARITASCFPVKRNQQTVGLNVNLSLSHWTKKAVRKRRHPHKYWCKPPICVTP